MVKSTAEGAAGSRDELLHELIAKGVNEVDVKNGLAPYTELTAAELQQQAWEQRDTIFVMAASQEQGYKQAGTRSEATRAPRPSLKRLLRFPIDLLAWSFLVVVSIAPVAGLAYLVHGYVPNWIVAAGLSILVTAAFAVAFVLLGLALQSRTERAVEDAAGVLFVAWLALGLFCLAYASWQLSHSISFQFGHGRVDSRSITAAVIVAGMGLLLYLASRAAAKASTDAAPGSDSDALSRRELETEASAAYLVWRQALQESVLGFLRQQVNQAQRARYSLELLVYETPGLRNAGALSFHVPTSAAYELVRLTEIARFRQLCPRRAARIRKDQPDGCVLRWALCRKGSPA